MMLGLTRSRLSGSLMMLWTYVLVAARAGPPSVPMAVAASDPLTARATRQLASVVRVTSAIVARRLSPASARSRPSRR